jgi:CRP-like cAMP-binding protein
MAANQSQNSLLAALSENDWERMRPDFRKVSFARGDTLLNSGDTLQQVYFPLSGVISAVADFETGSVEMGTVGAEGLIDTGVVLGSRVALTRYLVQVPGMALAIPYHSFRHWENTVPAFRELLLAYAQAFLVQLMQSVACNARHSVSERAARWLLTCQDRSGGDQFELTQEFLAEMLGVSRPIVNTTARIFQRAGLIRYNRGIVTVMDRVGLEEASCECYSMIRKLYDRLLSNRM